MSAIKLCIQVVEDLKALNKSVEALANALQSDKPKPAPSVTIEEVRAVLAAKKQEGKSITELLNNFGVRKLTDIAPESYVELLKAAGEL